MIFSTACFLAYFWSTYFVPETANVSLEEIDAVFRSTAGSEDGALKRQVGVTVGCAGVYFDPILQIEQELGLPDLIRNIWPE